MASWMDIVRKDAMDGRVGGGGRRECTAINRNVQKTAQFHSWYSPGSSPWLADWRSSGGTGEWQLPRMVFFTPDGSRLSIQTCGGN